MVGLAYVGMMLVLMLLENRFIYHPAKYETSWVPPVDSAIEDVWLTADDGTRLHAWWCPVAEPQWFALYCHGNAGNLSHRQPIIRLWQQHVGAAVLIFDYPGYGRSAGKPSEAGCYAAARAAYRHLVEERQAPPDRLVLYGGSLGGAMAVELAIHSPHRALVLLSAFTSIPDMAQVVMPLFPARWLARTRYDNLNKLRDYHGPIFLAHGTADQVVPYEHSERLFAASPSRLKQFCPLRGAGHDDAAGPELFKQINSFLQGLPAGTSP
jgi:fermentation-respiration switch protein FrsA (DUF1100 family)